MMNITSIQWIRHFIKNNRLYLKIMASYLILFITIFIIESISMVTIAQIYRQNSINTTLSNMEKSIRLFEYRLSEIRSISLNLSSDPLITDYKAPSDDDMSFNYLELNSISKRLQNYLLANDRLENILICYTDTFLIVSPFSSTFRIREFEDYIQIQGYTKEELLDLFFIRNHSDIFLPLSQCQIGKVKKNTVIYISGFPSSPVKSPRGNLFLFIDEAKINEYFTVFTDMGGWFVISDKRQAVYARSGISGDELHSVLYKTADDQSVESYEDRIVQSVDDNSNMVFSYTSPHNGWIYTIGLPMNAITKQYSAIRQIYKTTNLLAFIIGTLLVAFIIWRNATPMNHIIRLLLHTANERSIELTNMDMVERSIQQLLSNKDMLEDQLKKQISLSNTLIVDRLFRGTLENRDEIKQIKEFFHYDDDKNSIFASILKVVSITEKKQVDIPGTENVYDLLINQVLKKLLPPNAHVHMMGKDRIVIAWVGQANEGPQAAVNSVFERIIHTLKILYGVKAYFLCGGIYKSITGAALSFHDALIVDSYAGFDEGDPVIWYSCREAYKKAYKYAYTIEYENRLINLIKMGITSDVSIMLNALHDEMGNYEQNQTDIISGLRNTVLRLMNDHHFTSAYDLSNVVQLLRSIDIEDSQKKCFDMLAEMLLTLCGLSQNSVSQKNKLYSDIRDYICSHYSDPNLSLSLIAGHFNLSECYFSSYFKELSLQNFSTYVENYRLNRAIALMNSTDLTINEIAMKCGYTNKITFYRAFKRNYFQSPSKYRSNQSN